MTADHRREWWAKKFPNTRQAKEFDQKYDTNYSGIRPGRRNITSHEAREEGMLR
jgi:hypothetical protein